MKIGFIGLGAMGRGIAANLQSSGHDLVVNDLRREAAATYIENGATWADTPQELASQVELVFTSLPTPQDFEAVALGPNGLASGFREGSVWFDLTTNSVEMIRKVHAILAEKGVHLMDAPVSGGPKGAANGRLAIWIGGDRDVYDSHTEILATISDDARYIGDIGAGTIAKLTHNMASLAINAVVAEVLTMGVKAGVDPLTLWEAIRNGGAGRQRAFDNIGRRFLQGKLDTPSFQLRLAYKDAQLAMQLGREAGVPMRLCNLTTMEMTEALNRGWGDRDSQSFLQLQQERAGVPPFKLAEEDVARVYAQQAESGYNVR
ncbi:NAD(P)-dependent oxidoreductase [Conexibacter sp. S30A1]|uniref:NAD(P)-dependent oxidoreductase n=1 Tax=Conexibacter sp. S30A1 TaxID=2937800 RepID=UPI00200EF4E6|nr:NAD(P)-dependent oxidoreductase [Conexibacter sp. S30A1]